MVWVRVGHKRGVAAAGILLAAGLLAAAIPAKANDADDCFEKSPVETIDQKSVVEAIDACTRVIALGQASGPALARIYNARAGSHYDLKDFDAAITDYAEAIKLDPSFTAAYTGLGLAYNLKSELGPAKYWYLRALAIPQNYNDGRWAHAMARSKLGSIFLVEGDLDSAITNYDEALRIEPTEADAYEVHMYRALAWNAKGDFDRALVDETAALERDTQFAPAYTNRGLTWRAKGDFDRAIADCNEAIRFDPAWGWSYTCRGLSSFAKGDYSAASADLGRAVELGEGGFTVLWRYLARLAAGEEASVELAENLARGKVTGWISPVVEVYLGRRSADSALAAEDNPAARCLTTFHLGEWYRLRRDASEAATMLRSAADICRRTFSEYHAAVPDPITFVEYYGVLGDLKRLHP